MLRFLRRAAQVAAICAPPQTIVAWMVWNNEQATNPLASRLIGYRISYPTEWGGVAGAFRYSPAVHPLYEHPTPTPLRVAMFWRGLFSATWRAEMAVMGVVFACLLLSWLVTRFWKPRSQHTPENDSNGS